MWGRGGACICGSFMVVATLFISILETVVRTLVIKVGGDFDIKTTLLKRCSDVARRSVVILTLKQRY